MRARTRLGAALAAVLALAAVPRAHAAGTGFEPIATAGPSLVSPLTLQASTITDFGSGSKPRKPKKAREPRPEAATTAEEESVLGAERAGILLRSLAVPGWGQATLGRRGSASVFGLTEIGAWAAFAAFRVQETMRQNTYERTARLSAGIDLDGRNEEYLRTVGNYLSSEEYNLYVVARDAANLYLTDPANPDMAGYRAYIAANSISGTNGWAWADVESLLRYRAQRKDAQRAGLRANSALAVAVANRIVSALHAARVAGQLHARKTSWRLDVTPHPDDPAGFHAGVRASF